MAKTSIGMAPEASSGEGSKQYRADLSFDGTSIPVVVPVNIQSLTITVYPGAGQSVSVETSTDSMSDVRKGVARWVSDPVVSGMDVTSSHPLPFRVSAVRFVATGQCEASIVGVTP